MHTLKVLAVGVCLLGLCYLRGRLTGGTPDAIPRSMVLFFFLWLLGTGGNMWFGVTRAGYSVREELPVFLLVYCVPALIAALIWFRATRIR